MKRIALPPTLLATALLVAACGGGNSGSSAQETVQGVAAIGAAIPNATVTVTNADGDTATAPTSASGNYTVEIGKAPPYLLKVEHNGQTLFSFAPAGGTAHITPLTTLALLAANDNQPLETLFDNWKNSDLANDAVIEAAKKVNAHLKTLAAEDQHGVDFSTINFFNYPNFAANGQGLDAVLDEMKVSISCEAASCTQTIKTPNGETLFAWNAAIPTTGITLSWTVGSGGTGTGGTGGVNLGSCQAPAAGAHLLVLHTTVMGQTVEACVPWEGQPPSSQQEFCAGEAIKQQLPNGTGMEVLECSFANSVGNYRIRLTGAGLPMPLEYTVKYTFVSG